MSAPEPQVRVESGEMDVYWWCCAACGVAGRTCMSRAEADRGRIEHEAQHTPYLDLQARWDARDKALRGLIEKWRAEGRHTGTVAGAYAAGRIDCADELERAMDALPFEVGA